MSYVALRHFNKKFKSQLIIITKLLYLNFYTIPIKSMRMAGDRLLCNEKG